MFGHNFDSTLQGSVCTHARWSG